MKKKASGPRCGDTGVLLNGIKAMRPKEYRRVSKRQRTVTRAYGGSLSANAVKDRILRAFLIEEQKVAKKIVAERAKKARRKAKEQE